MIWKLPKLKIKWPLNLIVDWVEAKVWRPITNVIEQSTDKFAALVTEFKKFFNLIDKAIDKITNYASQVINFIYDKFIKYLHKRIDILVARVETYKDNIINSIKDYTSNLKTYFSQALNFINERIIIVKTLAFDVRDYLLQTMYQVAGSLSLKLEGLRKYFQELYDGYKEILAGFWKDIIEFKDGIVKYMRDNYDFTLLGITQFFEDILNQLLLVFIGTDLEEDRKINLILAKEVESVMGSVIPEFMKTVERIEKEL